VQGNGNVELLAVRRFAASSGCHSPGYPPGKIETSSERYQLASFAGDLKVHVF